MEKMASKHILYPASKDAMDLYHALDIHTNECLSNVVASFKQMSSGSTLQVTSYRMKSRHGPKWTLHNCSQFKTLLESAKKGCIPTKMTVFKTSTNSSSKEKQPSDKKDQIACDTKKLGRVSESTRESKRRKTDSSQSKPKDVGIAKSDDSSGSNMHTSPVSPLKLIDKHGEALQQVPPTAASSKTPDFMQLDDHNINAVDAISKEVPRRNTEGRIETEISQRVSDTGHKVVSVHLHNTLATYR